MNKKVFHARNESSSVGLCRSTLDKLFWSVVFAKRANKKWVEAMCFNVGIFQKLRQESSLVKSLWLSLSFAA